MKKPPTGGFFLLAAVAVQRFHWVNGTAYSAYEFDVIHEMCSILR
jgi:hypothetical protein